MTGAFLRLEYSLSAGRLFPLAAIRSTMVL